MPVAVSITVASLDVLLVDSAPFTAAKQLAGLLLQDVRVTLARHHDDITGSDAECLEHIALSVGAVQMDSGVDAAEFDFPVVLYCCPPDASPALNVTVIRDGARGAGLACRTVRVVAPHALHVQLEETFCSQLLAYAERLAKCPDVPRQSDTRAAGQMARVIQYAWRCPRAPPIAVDAAPPSARAAVTIQDLDISALAVHVSLRTARPVFVSVDDACLSLRAYHHNNMSCPLPRLIEHLAAHYTGELVLSAGWLVGSLGLIGRPASMARHVADGLHDMLAVPVQSAALGPGAFVGALATGAASLTRHVAAGMLTSLLGVATSLSRNAEALAQDDTHRQIQRSIHSAAPVPAAQALVRGAAGFGFSVFSALAGIVDQPLRAFVQPHASAGTVAVHMGRGVIGAVAKPVGGALDLVSQTSLGMLHSAGLQATPAPVHRPTTPARRDRQAHAVRHMHSSPRQRVQVRAQVRGR